MESSVGFVAPVVVARASLTSSVSFASSSSKARVSSGSSDFIASGLKRSSFLADSVDYSPSSSSVQFTADRTFEISCKIPLLDYRPSTRNERVAPIGQSLIEEKPEAFTTLLRSAGDVEEVIWAAYRQIYGEHQILSAAKQPFLESQLRIGELTVKDFIRGLVTSEPFLNTNFYPNSNYRFVELVVQRVLGRSAYKSEAIAWSIVIGTKGVAGFIADLTDSDEYSGLFGDYTVPYQRDRVLAGRAGGAIPFNIQTPRVDQKTAFKQFGRQSVPSFGVLSQKNRADFAVSTDAFVDFGKVYPSKKYAIRPGSTLPPISFPFKTNNARVKNIGVNLTDERPKLYSDRFLPDAIEREEIVYSAIRQVFSEHQNIKWVTNQLKPLLSQFKNGDLSVKELVKGLLKSDPFIKLNYEPNSNYRFVDIVLERALGREAYNKKEKIAWSIVICNKGVDGLIDAVLDTDEYKSTFGDNVVPYQVARVLPNRAGGETPYRLKTPRYGADYRKKYTLFFDWEATTSRYIAADKIPKAGDPKGFLKTAQSIGYLFQERPKVLAPLNYNELVPKK